MIGQAGGTAFLIAAVAACAWLIVCDIVTRWRHGTAQAEAERITAENEAIRLASDDWGEFVREHPLGDVCPDCSLWDAEGDRPVPKPCDKHKEQAQ